jgi:hypothetical protein
MASPAVFLSGLRPIRVSEMETTVPRDIITEDIRQIEAYINRTWKHLSTEKEIRLNKIFPEPENVGLKHIWRYGSADLVVYRHDKPTCIIESGGSHHWEEKQSLNDRRKWKLAEINGVRCLTMMNGMMERLSNRKWRELLGGFLFGREESEAS